MGRNKVQSNETRKRGRTDLGGIRYPESIQRVSREQSRDVAGDGGWGERVRVLMACTSAQSTDARPDDGIHRQELP